MCLISSSLHNLFAKQSEHCGRAAGKCYLYMKTIERAHTPKNMWQKIKLKKNYAQVRKCIHSLQLCTRFFMAASMRRSACMHCDTRLLGPHLHATCHYPTTRSFVSTTKMYPFSTFSLFHHTSQALDQLDAHLQHWPKFLVHKNKQRLTKITQYLIRMRKLALKGGPELVTMPARCVTDLGLCGERGL